MKIRIRVLPFLTYFLVGIITLLLLFEILLYVGGTPFGNWVLGRFNANQNGEASVDKLHVSFLRGFPRVCLNLEGFKYYEHPTAGRLEGEAPILHVEALQVGINPWRLLWQEVRVTEVDLDSGYVGLVVYPDSSLNLLNALGALAEFPESEPATTPREKGDFAFVLKDLDVRRLDLHVDDQPRRRGVDFLLERWEHQLSYRRQEIRNNARLKGELETLWARGDTLISDFPCRLTAAFRLDRDNYFADIRRCELQAGTITLEGSGTYDHMDGGRADVKASLTAAGLDLRPLLVLGVLDSTFFTEQITGELAVEGTLRGKLRTERPYLAVDFHADSIRFDNRQGLPLLNNLSAAGFFTTGTEQDLSGGELRLDHFDLDLVDGSSEGRLVVKNFVKPSFDIHLKGDHGLSVIEDFYPPVPVQDLSGRLVVKLDFSGNYDPDQAYGLNFETANGRVALEKVAFTLPGRDLRVRQIDLDLQNDINSIELRQLLIKANNSDLSLKGSLENAVAYYFGAPIDLLGELTVESGTWRWDDFLTDPFLLNILDSELNNSYVEFEFRGDGQGRIKGRLLPSGYLQFRRFHAERSNSPDIRRIRGKLVIKPDVMSLEDLTGVVGESDFSLSAGIKNYHGYAARDTSLDIIMGFQINSEKMRAYDFLMVNGKFLGPPQYQDEILQGFDFAGDYRFNNQELVKRRKVPNSTLRITGLNFNFSLFPASVVEVKMALRRQENQLLLNGFSGRIGESDFLLSGKLLGNNDSGGPFSLNNFSSSLDITSSYLNFDELMAINHGEKEEGAAAASTRLETPPADTMEQNAKETLIRERLASFNLFDQDFPEASFSLQVDSLRIFGRKIEGLNGKLIISREKTIALENLGARLGVGEVVMNGSVDASDPDLLLLTAGGRFLDADLSKIKVPFVYDSISYNISENFGGRMDAGMELVIAVTPDLAFDLSDASGTIDFSLREGQIRNFTPLLILGDFLGDKDLDFVRIDTVTNVLTLEDGILTLPLMDINSTIGHIRMAGFQNVNGEMEYLMQIPLGLISQAAWNYLSGKDRKEDAAEDEIERGSDNTVYIAIRIIGTPDDYKIRLGKGKSFREMVREARKQRREQRKLEKEEGKARNQ